MKTRQESGRLTRLVCKFFSYGMAYLLSMSALAVGGEPLVTIDPTVTAVASGGLWEADGKRGRYRIVITKYGDEHIYSRTFAQWLVINENGKMVEWLTRSVSDLTDQPMFIVRGVQMKDAPTDNTGLFEAAIANRYSEERRSVEIRLGKPGEISLHMPEGD